MASSRRLSPFPNAADHGLLWTMPVLPEDFIVQRQAFVQYVDNPTPRETEDQQDMDINASFRTKVILAADNYPPFSHLTQLDGNVSVSGFGPEFARGLERVCHLDVSIVPTQWSRCWNDVGIGDGLLSNEYHGCTTYTHEAGFRNEHLEFSRAILNNNKAAGLLVRLNADGNPDGVDGSSSLHGIKVVDVPGFAPSPDNLAMLTNSCTGEPFSGYEFVPVDQATDAPNDDALRTLLSGSADAMFVYADQVEHLKCHNQEIDHKDWDCELWERFGTDFAYIHIGQFGWTHNGTTLSIAKKGTGLAELLNPCIQKLMTTEFYYDLCTRYGFEDYCYPNEFFPEDNFSVEEKKTAHYNIPTNTLTTSCNSGYCACPTKLASSNYTLAEH